MTLARGRQNLGMDTEGGVQAGEVRCGQTRTRCCVFLSAGISHVKMRLVQGVLCHVRKFEKSRIFRVVRVIPKRAFPVSAFVSCNPGIGSWRCICQVLRQAVAPAVFMLRLTSVRELDHTFNL